MIDSTDFTIPGTGALRNKLGITDPAALSRAATDATVTRLAELQATPLRGGFDSAHLQAIHHHIYQDLYDWAGELRSIEAGNVPASQVEKSLNSVLDRLSRQNHLKSLSAEEWAGSASAYLYDLGTIQPFWRETKSLSRNLPSSLHARTTWVCIGTRHPASLPVQWRSSARLSNPQTCGASSCWRWMPTPLCSLPTTVIASSAIWILS